MKNFKTAEDIFDFAINLEQESHEFYISLSKFVTSKEIQDLLNCIAAEELKHKKKIITIKNTKHYKISDKQAVSLNVKDYYVEQKPIENTSYSDWLILTMEKKKAAFKLYDDLAKLTSDKLLEIVFRSLAQEEANHKLKLEIEYDSFAC